VTGGRRGDSPPYRTQRSGPGGKRVFRLSEKRVKLGIVLDTDTWDRLRHFRQALYDDLGRRQDSFFELSDRR
jgi:hypothetical protein